jgi:hypothetical protein
MGSVAETEDRFRNHLPALAASGLMTIVMSFASSYFGRAGTLIGLGGGCLLSGTGAWWTERALRKSAAIARAKAAARRARGGRELTAQETMIIEKVHGSRQRGIGWKRISGLAVAGLLAAVFTVTVLEHAVGKPVSDVVRDRPGHGTTFGRVTGPAPLGTPAPAVSPSGYSPDPSPDPDAAPPGPFASVTVSAAPLPGPDLAPTTPSAGSATDVPASPTPSAPGQP